MGSRFWISGVQIGMLLAFAEQKDVEKSKEILQEILDNQFTGNTTDEVEK